MTTAMECRKTTLLFLLISSICFSQEICNNAIDDDADGLIDINDTDCHCATAGGSNNIASYLPNPSFEGYTLCPTGPSQLAYSDIWEQCTNTTADFINTCGYVPSAITEAGLLPFPQGQSISGAIFSEEWKEYLGAALSQPMEAGTTYQITFNIASLPVNGDGETCNNGVINYGAVDVTIFGAASASALPVNTVGSPMANPQWIALGSAQYLPTSTWGQLTIIFTPSVNINAVMLGAPEQLPAEYANNTCYPYFLMDNLTLNEASVFGPAIHAQGDYCSGNLVLSLGNQATASAVATNYQWYKNGIAVIGATGSSFAVTNALPQDKISAKITSGSSCYITPQYTIIPSIGLPTVSVSTVDCSAGTGTITVTSSGALYSFNNGQSWTTQNTSSVLNAGSYSVKVKSASNCESPAVEVALHMNSVSAPAVADIELCQFATATPLTATGTNLLWYTSAEGGTGSQTAPYPSTAEVGTSAYYVSQTINGCESPLAAINVTVIPGASAPISEEFIYYCQFSEAAALTAKGSELLWYTTLVGGNSRTEAPVPATNIAGTTKYYVSQIKNGCESTRTLITVTVFEAPAAPVVNSYVRYYQNDRAEILTAEGENIVWYDADGNYLEGAPTPDTKVIGIQRYFATQSVDGCESPKAEIVVEVIAKEVIVDFPKFFTPNGDGQNEVWNIKKGDNIADAEVYIYDRNGQLLKQVKQNGEGWDGTFNGRSLPASDYWFKVTYKEYGVQREYTSHFSLVR
jgi:gliding motility-associated-like protein